jgi:predicted metal-binding membrane protein
MDDSPAAGPHAAPAAPASGGAPSTALEAIVRRDRLVVLAGVAALAGLGWLYLLMMAGMDDVAAPALRPWTGGDFAMMFSMWAVMMVAMMLPSAAPFLLVHARVARQNLATPREGARADRPRAVAIGPTGVLASGYLLAWTAFSLVATVLQWALERAALVSPRMVATTPYLASALLVAAGIYQLTPLKRACLAHCRSPIAFLMHDWRSGLAGALRMGVEHGFYCIGCCWFLMGLLFVGGVMNLLWIAGLSIFVLVEKAAPRGEAIARVAGALFVAAGVWIAVAGPPSFGG